MGAFRPKEPLAGARMGWWIATLLIAAGTMALFLPPSLAQSTNQVVADSDIAHAVDEEFTLEEGVCPNDVDVSASQGIVTLSGSVEDLLAKARAVKIAESVRGVRGVIDRMTVVPVSRGDAAIRRDILLALLQDPATESYQVTASVHNAVATLTGSVGSYPEKQLVARIAEGVSGIKEIDNEVTINNLPQRTDQEIAADVEARLDWDIWLDGSLIHASAHRGKVTLTGTVGSAFGKERAFDDAYVNGVTAIDDSGLKVDPWTSNKERRSVPFLSRSDSQIKQAVLTAFRFDPRVAAFSPDVTVEGGVIILGGTVGNLAARNAAEQDARNIVGVWGVENFLRVRPPEQPTDAEMEKQLRAALFWDPVLVGARVDAAVIRRVAYLSGAVDSPLQMAEAQDIASRIKGVVLVRNRLKVETESTVSYYSWPDLNDDYDDFDGWLYGNRPPYTLDEKLGPGRDRSDQQIKERIQRALFWSPFVDRDDITVTVNGGVATLTGTVGSQLAWREANRDARKAGAGFVMNQLKIRRRDWL